MSCDCDTCDVDPEINAVFVVFSLRARENCSDIIELRADERADAVREVDSSIGPRLDKGRID